MWALGDQRQSAAERKREMRGETPVPVPVASNNNKKTGVVASNRKKKAAAAFASKQKKTSNVVLGLSTKDNIKNGAPAVVASKTKQERGSNVLEAVMTGLEFA